MADRSGSLARGAAVQTVASALSRLTGFLRVVAVAAAMGTTFLANTYQTANTAPNVVFELLAAGVLTSVFVPTFVDYLVRDRASEGWDAANAMTSVAMVGLVGLALLVALLAPAILWLLTLGVQDDALRSAEISLGSTFLRLFAPQIVFYGAGMIMTGALHAHRKFALAAVAPIFNNVVVIAVYLTYAAMRGDESPTVQGITTSETLVLGLGTTLGVVAMTVALIPQLAGLGWRFRFRFEPLHPAVRKAARLGVWALGYAGGYQAGLIVVLMLANGIEGGVAAYQWAYTFFYVPHAVFAVPIFNVLFPVMSEHVARGEEPALAERLIDGIAMVAFILLPVAGVLLTSAGPVTTLSLEYGVMTGSGAELVGRVLAAFALGLPAYSAFLVLTRAFYAFGDTKTPTLVNAGAMAVASVVGAGLFLAAEEAWAVPGLALGHSAAFVVAGAVMMHLLRRRVGGLHASGVVARVWRSGASALVALTVMVAVAVSFPQDTKPEALLSLIVTVAAGGAAYLGVAYRLRAPELWRFKSLFVRRPS
ncbi:MAG: murein biosynthesis integral membrane protein MurJ [Actinomycetota bacterium]